MKVYKKDFKTLFFEFGVETLDDLWFLNIFISQNDVVGGKTTRRFRVNDSENSEKKTVFLKIKAEKIDLNFELGILKILGKIIDGVPLEYVNIGEYHSFDLSFGDTISITKNLFLELHKKMLNNSLNKIYNKKIMFLILDDDSALIAKLNDCNYTLIAEIKFKGSGKKNPDLRNKNRIEYFSSILKIFLNSDYETVIVGGPGFEKDNFQKYLLEKNLEKKQQSKFIFTNIGSPGISGIREALNGGILNNILNDNAAQQNTQLINEFLKDLSKEKPVAYGFEEIKQANEKNALKLVLITDDFFKNNFEELKDFLLKLDNKKIDYKIVSSNSDSGKIISSFSGIIAFLYY